MIKQRILNRLKKILFPLVIKVFDGLVPKSRNTWVIAGKGAGALSKNAKCLLDYCIESGLPEEVYCLSTAENRVDDVRQLNPGTFRGLWVLLKSSVIFITHGTNDLYWPSLANPGRRLIINLWHGIILKRIGITGEESESTRGKHYRNETGRYSYFTVSSQLEQIAVSACLQLPLEKVLVTGIPRNDLFFEAGDRPLGKPEIEDKLKGKKVILYAPTFRDYRETDGFMHCLKDFDLVKLREILARQDAVLLVRKHRNDKYFPEFPLSESIINCDNNTLADVQELLAKVDLLITDYSGIMYDYLLLNKPIIALTTDIERYIQKRGFIFDFNGVFPGERVNTFGALAEWLDKYLNNSELHMEKRKSLQGCFHKYRDGASSRRIVDFVRNKLN